MSTTKYVTPTDPASKAGRKAKSSQLMVVSFVMRDGEPVEFKSLLAQEQRQLATQWTLRAMRKAGYVLDRELSESGVTE
jgi:hypothetical protein